MIHTRSSPSLRQFLAQEPATLTLGSNCLNLFTEKKRFRPSPRARKKKDNAAMLITWSYDVSRSQPCVSRPSKDHKKLCTSVLQAFYKRSTSVLQAFCTFAQGTCRKSCKSSLAWQTAKGRWQKTVETNLFRQDFMNNKHILSLKKKHLISTWSSTRKHQKASESRHHLDHLQAAPLLMLARLHPVPFGALQRFQICLCT